MIKQNRAVTNFKKLGYKIVNINSSGFKYVDIDGAVEYSELKSDQFYTNDFESNLMQNTLLKNVVDNVLN